MTDSVPGILFHRSIPGLFTKSVQACTTWLLHGGVMFRLLRCPWDNPLMMISAACMTTQNVVYSKQCTARSIAIIVAGASV
jgi:hypothetical protein